jgi:hypothetical protein
VGQAPRLNRPRRRRASDQPFGRGFLAPTKGIRSGVHPIEGPLSCATRAVHPQRRVKASGQAAVVDTSPVRPQRLGVPNASWIVVEPRSVAPL